MNVNELRQENAAKGWTSIPESCPARFVNAICEKRSRSIATGIPLAPSEQRGYGAFTRLTQHVVKPAGKSAAVLLAEATVLVQKNLAAANRAVEEERAENARIAEEVRVSIFPWEPAN